MSSLEVISDKRREIIILFLPPPPPPEDPIAHLNHHWAQESESGVCGWAPFSWPPGAASSVSCMRQPRRWAEVGSEKMQWEAADCRYFWALLAVSSSGRILTSPRDDRQQICTFRPGGWVQALSHAMQFQGSTYTGTWEASCLSPLTLLSSQLQRGIGPRDSGLPAPVLRLQGRFAVLSWKCPWVTTCSRVHHCEVSNLNFFSCRKSQPALALSCWSETDSALHGIMLFSPVLHRGLPLEARTRKHALI